MVVEGFTNPEIAKVMGTTEQVVKNYMKPIYDKSGMGTRLELALWWLNRTSKENVKT